MLHVTGLKKTLGNFSLSINELVIEKPGIYGLIGPNGCGKTTVAKLIMDIISRDAGSIDFGGLTAQDITMLPQKPYMMDDTVYNNLVYPLKLRGIKPDENLCKEYLHKIGLWEQQKQRAKSLSSGEQQKLGFMRSLIFEPKLLIVDEALTDLDIDSLDMVEHTILSMQKRTPIMWFIISHQLPHIKRLCDYIFFMSAGKIETHGTVEEILKHSQNPHVLRYLQHEMV
jgi:ABC-type multidrug transport system ATPase subunit